GVRGETRRRGSRTRQVATAAMSMKKKIRKSSVTGPGTPAKPTIAARIAARKKASAESGIARSTLSDRGSRQDREVTVGGSARFGQPRLGADEPGAFPDELALRRVDAAG